MTEKRGTIATAILAVVVAMSLCGCVELPVAGGGMVYSAFHKPDPLSKAYVALRRHDCTMAYVEFANFLANNPNDAHALSGQGDAFVCLDKYDDAIAAYSSAIAADPKWFDYLGRGIAYKAKGDQTKAIQNFDQGIALAPTIPALYVYRGAVQSARGDASGARADFEKVSSLISDRRGVFNRYGWALATSWISAYRDGPAAIEYATRACDLSSWKNANELDTLAAAYAEAGQFDHAIKWQSAALQLGTLDREEFEARLALYRKQEPYISDNSTAIFF